MTNQNLDVALAAAARGWVVFACNADKTPRVWWQRESTNDPAAVTRLWKRWPMALVGINCEQSGIFAVDIDNKHGKDGSAEWARLVETYGGGVNVAVGPAQATPSGGYHLIFRWPADLAIPNKVNGLGPGLDLRSRGYICSGEGYTWLPGHDLTVPLSDPPAWLVDLIRIIGRLEEGQPPQPPARVIGLEGYFLQRYLAAAQPGNRNQNAFNLACQLRDCGLTIDQARPYLLEYARRVPQVAEDRYSEREATASLRSAYNRPAREPAGQGGGQ